ncbi:unnamed protein product [Mytilus edulis]|uniref:Uncharacterized protein n=1 Tax=Mytilus edulis TaxID=6550 RepID=A0A8S3RJE0_MYTED|nr:unnamed protein product [Mytilus edulis]
MQCSSVGQIGELRCKEGARVNIDKIWLDNNNKCEFDKNSSSLTLKGLFDKNVHDSTTLGGEPSTESHGGRSLPGNEFGTDVQDDNNTPVDEPSTALHSTHAAISYFCDSIKTSDEENRPDWGANVCSIAGGIAGVVIITCIIVGVFRYRRRNVQKNGRKNTHGKLNPTNDKTQEQPGPVNNQEAYLMNVPDSVHMPASHAVILVISTDASNTYSHLSLKSTEDDSDVMYDHTVRHNVHNTCEGDYGIAHRRITEDDYDVSGNYRQSFSNKEDPVYN